MDSDLLEYTVDLICRRTSSYENGGIFDAGDYDYKKLMFIRYDDGLDGMMRASFSKPVQQGQPTTMHGLMLQLFVMTRACTL